MEHDPKEVIELVLELENKNPEEFELLLEFLKVSIRKNELGRVISDGVIKV
ncbi:TPA: hypothetical protein STU32_003894 [Clostridioides difficile]|nr:hypothetical protein [Clostridioides difficile]MDV9712519.1 hypothetical protein [Clostridioides difficile]CZR91322.1 hypothetical protein CDFC105_13879 [Clostridioides difficile]CZS11707.1 hypothetical protein CDFC105_93870 [Clostridioides difficile]HBF0218060.1 hypothetical protein [Clostridioides difficile]HBF6619178.1 hypothetical protein [Clostridioides difficile]